MRKAIQTLGFLIAAMGVSGTIDHLLGQQPLLGFLNAVNRLVIPRIDALAGYELYANLIVVILGAAVIVAAHQTAPRR